MCPWINTIKPCVKKKKERNTHKWIVRGSKRGVYLLWPFFAYSLRIQRQCFLLLVLSTWNHYIGKTTAQVHLNVVFLLIRQLGLDSFEGNAPACNDDVGKKYESNQEWMGWWRENKFEYMFSPVYVRCYLLRWTHIKNNLSNVCALQCPLHIYFLYLNL